MDGVELQVRDFFEEEDAVMAAVNEREIWLQNNNNNNNGENDEHIHENDLLAGVLDDASMFYTDDDDLNFHLLPDFPCMSSSSSSSSTPAPVRTVTCVPSNTTSSAAASLTNLKSDAEDPAPLASASALSSTASMEIQQPPPPSSAGHGGADANGGDCLDMMDTIDTSGYMELLESSDFFDPASMFENDENPLEELGQLENANETVTQQQREEPPRVVEGGDDEEMSSVFLEWLKTNKERVSASDLRSVKLKKATIECAANRLGGGKEGMKQLLKLILDWVQTSHLQNKKRKENHTNNDNNNYNYNYDLLMNQFQDNPSPSFNFSLNHQSSFGAEWFSPPPYPADTAVPSAPARFPQAVIGYNAGDPFSNGASSEFRMLESTNSWPHSDPFTVNVAPPPQTATHYSNNFYQAPPPPYQCQFFQDSGGADRGMRLGPSATKEARKKRMARQRRYLSHHRRDYHHGQQSQEEHQTGAAHANPANWLYWPPVMAAGGDGGSVAPVVPDEPPSGKHVADWTAMQSHQNYQQSRVSSDKRQPEKNLKFLLQKVLKQSDVGNLGRIVLPKKEAETHLPELEARDGISIAMEDIGTSRVWNMRYRYWPNNKSRMYLLENTGDFVRSNGLQEGDFIVIYKDVKCGKFMIRGVKVRQAGAKPETKKAGKSQNGQHGNDHHQANNGSPSSLKTQTQKNEKNSQIQ